MAMTAHPNVAFISAADREVFDYPNARKLAKATRPVKHKITSKNYIQK